MTNTTLARRTRALALVAVAALLTFTVVLLTSRVSVDSPADDVVDPVWDCLLDGGYRGLSWDGAERLYPARLDLLVCRAAG